MRVPILIAAFMVPGSALPAQSTFALGFSGPTSMSGIPEDPWSGDFSCTLTSTAEGKGAQGWSISLSAEEATILSVTLDGTEAQAHFSGGFAKSELTDRGTGGCAGRQGAVSAVVLSFTENRTLPANATTSIARITAVGTIPSFVGFGGGSRLFYVDDCQGAGQPVQNNITEDGATVKPELGQLEILHWVFEPCARAPLLVGFSAAPVSSTVPYEGIADDGSGFFTAGGGTIVVGRSLGSSDTAHVYANIVSREAGGGVQGWSLSIALDSSSEVHPVGAQVEGLPALNKYFSHGFKKTDVIFNSPTAVPRIGFVSACVLSFVEPRVLPSTGTESVLDMELGSARPQDEVDSLGQLAYRDGLRGSGQPVLNAMTVEGATMHACNRATAEVNVVFRFNGLLPASELVRGDANDDARVNLADAIYIVNALFRRGPPVACRDAADANDDQMTDASDAVFLVEYLFAGGDEPPPPFGACGVDPGATLESCPAGIVTACP